MKKHVKLLTVVVLGLALILAIGVGLWDTARAGQANQEGAWSLEGRLFNQVMSTAGDDSTPEGQMGGMANMASGESPIDPQSIDVDPLGTLDYQGRMIKDGTPFNGTINITFRLYGVESGGTHWWEETQSVDVQNGLFNVRLGSVVPLDDLAVNFQSQIWLGIQPAGAASELTPRQPLGVVGYAMNLMPGATMVDTNVGGPYGYSFFVTSTDHPAIYGSSGSSTGITGITSADNAPGVYGSTSGSGNSSQGLEARMYGDTGICSVGETECGSGLYATAAGDAYGIYSYGANRAAYIGIQGDNSQYSLWLHSTISPNGYGIYTDGESQFVDYVTFSGGKSGYVVDIALNDGEVPLEQGDVVVITGFDVPVVGEIPVARVRKVSEANATAVMGIVDVLYVPCQNAENLQAGQACGGFEQDITTIQPGQYLSVVTLGAYHSLKVDASSGPILPGDLLATSTSGGFATKAVPLEVSSATFYAPGTVVGKAMGSLEEGSGIIPVFVSLK